MSAYNEIRYIVNCAECYDGEIDNHWTLVTWMVSIIFSVIISFINTIELLLSITTLCQLRNFRWHLPLSQKYFSPFL